LFFLQSFATLLFGTEFRNIGVRLPITELGDIYISYARLWPSRWRSWARSRSIFFLRRTFIGTAIRAIAGPATSSA
jgi:branched-chain amino acid transport system permease protein